MEPSIYCRKCGYILHGLLNQTCPECGRAFDPNDPSTYSSYQWPCAFARLPLAVTILVAIFIPGLASVLILGFKRRGWAFAGLVSAIPATFVFFGPIWGEVLFADAGHRMREVGLWPFLGCCAVTIATSVVLAIRDRKSLER